MGRLFCVIPCYNEQEVLPETSSRIRDKLLDLISKNKIDSDSRIVFVNDGSKDATWDIITDLHHKDPVFQGINLSRNMGHQNALLAGLMTVKDSCDCAISLDADLQDDIEAIEAMIDKFNEGVDVVYGVRSKRTTDTFFKRFTAEGFYKVMNSLGANTVYNHADYRLMSRRALLGLAEFGEVNLFLRGIVPMVGYKSDVVYYERAERFAGESKYPLKKMLSFAVEGITSLSTKPIKLITGLGIFIFLVSIAVFIYSLIRYFNNQTVPGWTTTVLSVWFIGGLMMISLGVIGEYIGKIYLETKNRPRFIIESYLSDDSEQKK
ncbi:MAG: glycosyltransferase family 2 protein [Butyrivibrio sp.]|uniref:glycosyltransferase family 2 protein n=1 Tax=Butyrivibrio sp. TaxID=28121 RepID=UPI001B7972CE|nr:glycosyltransferase family 2 protein [Butyrivibrio sp.]MBP3784550.1 glycosyltransferase family 2 protein [Butyrivibrio sp.]